MKQTYHSDFSKDQQPSRFIHTGNHWVVSSNISGAIDEVTVYDSLNKAVSKSTQDVLKRLLKKTGESVCSAATATSWNPRLWHLRTSILHIACPRRGSKYN